MDGLLVTLLIVLGVAIFLMGVCLGVAGSMGYVAFRLARGERLKQRRPASEEADEEPGETASEKAVEDGSKPLPVMEDDPPRMLVYNPKRPEVRAHCHCHDEELTPGQQVLYWPLEGGKAVLFCQRGMDERQGREV